MGSYALRLILKEKPLTVCFSSGKVVERSRRLVIKRVCAIRRAGDFRTQNKRVFKALVFKNILHELLSIKSTSTKASFNIDAFGGKNKARLLRLASK